MTVVVNTSVSGGGSGGSFAALSGNPTDNSALNTALNSNIETVVTMGGTVIDVTLKVPNRLTLTATSVSLTFSATPSDGQTFSLQVIGYSSDCTVTVPSCYSETQQATLTTFVVPANAKVTMWFIADASVVRLIGEPVAGEYGEQTVASAATTSIGATTSRSIKITGTTTITSLGTAAAGTYRYGYFASALAITNGASLNIVGGASINVQAGAQFVAWTTATDTWRLMASNGSMPLLMDTWTNIKALAPTAGTMAYVTDLLGASKGLTLQYINGRWKPPTGMAAIGYMPKLSDLTGSTSETARGTITVLGGLMGADDMLIWRGLYSWTNNANTKTHRLRLNGIAGTKVVEDIVTTNQTERRDAMIIFQSSASSQAFFPSQSDSMQASSGAVETGAINFASNVDIVFSQQLGTGTDSAKFYGGQLLWIAAP